MNQLIHSPRQFADRGLAEDLENAETLQTIECPHCKKSVEFEPNKLYWEFDGDFEYCFVDCPKCKKEFELCAADGMLEYTFFTN